MFPLVPRGSGDEQSPWKEDVGECRTTLFGHTRPVEIRCVVGDTSVPTLAPSQVGVSGFAHDSVADLLRSSRMPRVRIRPGRPSLLLGCASFDHRCEVREGNLSTHVCGNSLFAILGYDTS